MHRRSHVSPTLVVASFVALTACRKSTPGPQNHRPPPLDAATRRAPPEDVPALPTLMGAWRGRPDSSVRGLVLAQPDEGRTFKFLMDRARACPDASSDCGNDRTTGGYSQTKDTLNLMPTGASPLALSFALDKDTVTLKFADGTTATLDRTPSYCDLPPDCAFDPAMRASLTCHEGHWFCNQDHLCNPQCSGGAPSPDDAGSTPSAHTTTDAGEESDATVHCGDVVCPTGQVCCNPLRSLCAGPDESCIQ